MEVSSCLFGWWGIHVWLVLRTLSDIGIVGGELCFYGVYNVDGFLALHGSSRSWALWAVA
jgi:hypothetical protein